jgi:hypothetical protein
MTATASWILCNRKGRRWSVSHIPNACIVFPCGAKQLQQPLLELGVGGISFSYPADAIELSTDFEAHDAQLQVGQHEIRGSFLLVHVTDCPESGRICGGRFTPATQSDGAKFLELLEELRAGDSLEG